MFSTFCFFNASNIVFTHCKFQPPVFQYRHFNDLEEHIPHAFRHFTMCILLQCNVFTKRANIFRRCNIEICRCIKRFLKKFPTAWGNSSISIRASNFQEKPRGQANVNVAKQCTKIIRFYSS